MLTINHRPPGCRPILFLPSPPLLGLTDTTSNVGFATSAGCN